jgi:CDP-glucose 4,6-dehydratase
VVSASFWAGRRVLVTGHTGFKGAWLLLMLRELASDVAGFALDPPSEPSLFDLLDARLGEDVRSDVRDIAPLADLIRAFRPQVVFHLAAQSTVQRSYEDPLETWSTNVMGTANLLEACRHESGVQAIVIATSDKCYENRNWLWGYRETDRLGGADPYSASKAAVELLVSSHRRSFGGEQGARFATARAGNVIGGGDFTAGRLLPDAARAFIAGEKLRLRNPNATRPWQHVLDPLRGYLMLAEAVSAAAGADEAWNFGPPARECVSARVVADRMARLWGDGAAWLADGAEHWPEAELLALDASKARALLGWQPMFTLETALEASCAWYKTFHRGEDVAALSRTQARRALALS